MAGPIVPVILSGGSGTRLWPLSRQLRPKQLLPLVGDRTMLQQTLARASGEPFAPPIILCNADHRFIIAEQVREIGLTARAVVLEPAARNTAPAAVVAALMLSASDPDALILLLPSDHVIADVAGFRQAVAVAAAAAAAGALVTFGVRPDRPETGYGYIRQGDPLPSVAGCFRVERFVEKPDPATARAYLDDGHYVWNSGMFLLPAAAFLAEVERLEPEMLALCRAAVAGGERDLDFLRLAAEPFSRIRPVSIDYAVMEHTARGAVVPVDIGWSDVGSWTALWELSPQDSDGNVAIGDVISLDTRNCYLRGDGHLLATLGVDDLVIVATDDVLLVAARNRAQEVKALVDRVQRSGRNEHMAHVQVFRPWGWFRRIHDGPRFQVKEIVVAPGQRLSRQMHHHRAEHWIVVSGTARVTRSDDVFYLTEDQSTYIPHNTPHCLENPGKIPLKMIEVQSGPYLGEDDIVRFEDAYGRALAARSEP